MKLNIKPKNVLVIGDFMLDEYIYGSADRISPEAPVPVVKIINRKLQLGGAGNVVRNVLSLGGTVNCIGVVGDDINGNEIIELMAQNNINRPGFIISPDYCTTIKTRVLCESHQMLRIDDESGHLNLSDNIKQALHDQLNAEIAQTDIVVVSDYNKGFITPEVMGTVIEACKKHNKQLIIDPKGKDFSLQYLQGATVITPNKKEAELATGIEIYDEETLGIVGNLLLNMTESEAILITLGSDGMALFQRKETVIDIIKIPSKAQQVFDVTGAGDTVVATMALFMANGMDIQTSATMANYAAGIVVGKIGSATLTMDELNASYE